MTNEALEMTNEALGMTNEVLGMTKEALGMTKEREREERLMALFWRKKTGQAPREMPKGKPAIRCSICTGEQVAGFRNQETGRFEEVMLLKTPEDLERFKQQYGITGEIEKIY